MPVGSSGSAPNLDDRSQYAVQTCDPPTTSGCTKTVPVPASNASRAGTAVPGLDGRGALSRSVSSNAYGSSEAIGSRPVDVVDQAVRAAVFPQQLPAPAARHERGAVDRRHTPSPRGGHRRSRATPTPARTRRTARCRTRRSPRCSRRRCGRRRPARRRRRGSSSTARRRAASLRRPPPQRRPVDLTVHVVQHRNGTTRVEDRPATAPRRPLLRGSSGHPAPLTALLRGSSGHPGPQGHYFGEVVPLVLGLGTRTPGFLAGAAVVRPADPSHKKYQDPLRYGLPSAAGGRSRWAVSASTTSTVT